MILTPADNSAGAFVEVILYQSRNPAEKAKNSAGKLNLIIATTMIKYIK
jgi:hypothetical protein